MELTLLAAFVVACVVISIAPGPDMMYIVANAIAAGRRAGVVAAVGMATGIAVHTVLAALGLGALIQAAPAVLDGLRVVGAVFLLYLAFSAWRSSRQPYDLDPGAASDGAGLRSLRRVYAMAVLTNLSNPKVIIFYLAFLPQFLTTGPGSLPATGQLLVLGVTLSVVGLSIDASIGMVAGTLSAKVLRRPGFRRWLERLSAAIFGGLAARLVIDARG